jgi:hypothetical protein
MSTFISELKRSFLKKCGEGLDVKMTMSFKSSEIFLNPTCDQEEYIKEHLLQGKEFSVYKFCEAVDTLGHEELGKLLDYFDSIDMVLHDVFEEASIYDYDLTFEERFYAYLIEEGDVHTFRDLINY